MCGQVSAKLLPASHEMPPLVAQTLGFVIRGEAGVEEVAGFDGRWISEMTSFRIERKGLALVVR